MYRSIKRILDILLSLLMLVVCLIPMIIISIAIKLEDGGTAIFKQERTGKDGKNFYLYKFRSMKINNDVRNFKEEDKITNVGKFIRKTSLDEIPQIFNILKGEMSFIGPRPWIPEYFYYMSQKQKQRVSVLPGITGLAQVMGRNGISVTDKINYDLEYVNNFSFKLDLKIVFLTIKTVLSGSEYECGKSGIKMELEELRSQEKVKVNA